MEFQYISDIHLETGNKIAVVPSAPYLILAGDIGNPYEPEYITFIRDVSKQFEHIFIVTGNHEYYNKNNISMKETENYIRNILSEFPNCHFMNNEIFDMPNSNVSIFGSTFWTQIEENEVPNITCFVRDYYLIPQFTPEVCNRLHDEAIHSLADKIKKHPNREWIVISHHIPKYDLIHTRYKNNPFNSAFASSRHDLATLLDQNNIVAVVYGHTHVPSIQSKYYCNPYGYPNEYENQSTSLSKTFRIEKYLMNKTP